jgi:hypothetical protein
MLEINGTLQIKDLWKPTKLRTNDVVLMSEFVSLGFSQQELRLINNWRLFFRVNTLAEICNPEGTRIQDCFLRIPTKSFTNQVNPSNLQWPNQGLPGKKGFSLWLKSLRMSFNTFNGRINHKFGNWKESTIITKNNSWNHFFQISTGSLFTKFKDSYYSISVESRKTNTAIYKNDRNVFHRIQHLPEDCIPTNLRLRQQRNILTATFIPIAKPARIIMNKQPHWTNSFIENTRVTDGPKLRHLFSQEEEIKIYIASDGGVHNYEGTFGVVLSDGNSPFAQNNGKFYSV